MNLVIFVQEVRSKNKKLTLPIKLHCHLFQASIFQPSKNFNTCSKSMAWFLFDEQEISSPNESQKENLNCRCFSFCPVCVPRLPFC